jgi:3-isopropylmalate/(R)-2-methylmalate dehydratase large subunit
MTQTMAEKILARASGQPGARAGETVTARPDRIMAYDFPGFVDVLVRQLEEDFGVRELDDPDRYVVFIDHLVTRRTPDEADLHRVTRDWAARTGINLHDDEGIGHQVAAELGYAVPGALIVHFDAHISGLGAFGALGLGLHRQLLEPWVTGTLTLEVPETVRIDFEGELAEHVDARDLLHELIRRFGADGFLGKVVEFGGAGAASLSPGERQTLCGMIMFTGGVSALFEPDAVALEYVEAVARTPYVPLWSDEGAAYAARATVDLGAVEPFVATPGSANAEHTVPISAAGGVAVSRGYIGSCASGRIDDLRAAASVLRGRRVHPGFSLTVVPTSARIHEQAEREGLIDVLRDAGATIAGSSCDYCFGYASPLTGDEACISTGVLNVRGRMGSPRAAIYIGSAATVAASAIAGEIADPRAVAR